MIFSGAVGYRLYIAFFIPCKTFQFSMHVMNKTILCKQCFYAICDYILIRTDLLQCNLLSERNEICYKRANVTEIKTWLKWNCHWFGSAFVRTGVFPK